MSYCRQYQILLAFGLLLLLLPMAQPARAQAGTVFHTVKPGENLFRIALYYGTTVDAIQAANGLTSVYIMVGQQLLIPGATNVAPPSVPLTPPPEGGVAGEPTPVPTAAVGDISARTYLVQSGDTLTAIAARFGVSPWHLRDINGLSSSSLIYAGMELILTGSSTQESEPAATPTPEPQVETTPEVPATETVTPEATATPAAGERTYTVQRGDTLTQIAARFGTSVAALSRLNSIANPSQIYVGQVLRLTGTAPAPTGAGKLIVVDLSDQHMWAYEGDQLVFSFVVSTGAAPSYTAAGDFRIQSKIPNAYGSAWDLWMPWWLGIYYAGSVENGIHALPILSNGQTLWAGYLGTPVSYGCVVLGTQEAELLYNWAEIGTPVSIRY
ncbi:MAG: LysM peptidoglycan-binding domain-containing protein [Anaerolineae bacterium]|nr:LysM peptidoglycan-binding domain-containing protein [Anaerolineae bacterium]